MVALDTEKVSDALIQQSWKMRPFKELFDSPFLVPGDMEKINDRLVHHVKYFKANYALFIGVCAAFYAYFNSWFGVSLLVSAACIGAAQVAAQYPITVGGRDLTTKEVKGILYTFAVLSMLITGALFALVWSIIVPTFVVAAHAVLKQRDMRKKASVMAENVSTRVSNEASDLKADAERLMQMPKSKMDKIKQKLKL